MRALSLGLAALLLGGAVTSSATPAAAVPSALDFTIGLVPGTDPKALFSELELTLHGTPEWIPGLRAVRAGFVFEDLGALMDKLEKPHPAIRYVRFEHSVDLNESEQNRLTGRELQTVRTPGVEAGGEPVTVAVLDTGVTANRDLPKERLVPGYDATRLPFVGLEDLPITGTTEDAAGFGTMAAGIIAGESGFCSTCRIMPVRIAHEYRGEVFGSSASLAAGIVWAADHGADIITTAGVVDSESPLIEEAVEHALQKDVLVVASAGKNIYNERPVYPASIEPVLAVSAVDTSGRVTGRYSSDYPGSRWIDVAAAEGAPALNHRGEASQLDGVEGATAVVAGAAALALSSTPEATAAQVRKAIVETAVAGELPVLNAAQAVYQVAGNDTAAPQIAATGLTAGQLISKPIDVHPAVSDDYGIALAEMTAGGRTVTASKPWETLRLTPPAGFTGDLAVSLKVTDVAGKTTSATTVVKVDTAGPTATTVNPKQNTRVRGTFTTSISGVHDASGLVKSELWANGKYLGTGSTKKVSTGKANGNVTLTWKLTDKLGNARAYTRTVIADNKAPAVSITKAPKHKAKVKGTVKVSVKAADAAGVARVELLVNGKVVATDKTAAYVLSVNTSKQKKTMKVQIRAYDKLGNAITTATRTWYRK